MSAAIAARAENGWPSDQRSRSVWITEVLRYWSFTTRPGIQAEIATPVPHLCTVSPVHSTNRSISASAAANDALLCAA